MGYLCLRNGYVMWNISAGYCPAQIRAVPEVSMASAVFPSSALALVQFQN